MFETYCKYANSNWQQQTNISNTHMHKQKHNNKKNFSGELKTRNVHTTQYKCPKNNGT